MLANQPIAQIHVGGNVVNLVGATYVGGRPAIRAVTADGEPYGMLTVNLLGEHLRPGEIHVKTWAENKSLREPALDSGRFIDTGRRIPAGQVYAELWRVVS